MTLTQEANLWLAIRGLWRYRVGDYRIICDIQDKNLVIAAITIGHRKDV